MARRIIIFLGLFCVWFVLSGMAKWPQVIMGLISCGFVTWISGDLILVDKGKSGGQMLGQAWRFLCYLPWILKEIVAANLHVLRLALSPSGLCDVNPRIVRYKTFLKSDIARFMFANSITLTPGTITMIMDGEFLFIHAISEQTEKGLYGDMERRIAAVYGESCPTLSGKAEA
jgi:multicomponent Na+:H+ antiporter subunit E